VISTGGRVLFFGFGCPQDLKKASNHWRAHFDQNTRPSYSHILAIQCKVSCLKQSYGVKLSCSYDTSRIDLPLMLSATSTHRRKGSSPECNPVITHSSYEGLVEERRLGPLFAWNRTVHLRNVRLASICAPHDVYVTSTLAQVADSSNPSCSTSILDAVFFLYPFFI